MRWFDCSVPGMIGSPPAAVWRKGVVCLQFKYFQNPQRQSQCVKIFTLVPVAPCHTNLSNLWTFRFAHLQKYCTESNETNEINESVTRMFERYCYLVSQRCTVWGDTPHILVNCSFRISNSVDHHYVNLYLIFKSWIHRCIAVVMDNPIRITMVPPQECRCQSLHWLSLCSRSILGWGLVLPIFIMSQCVYVWNIWSLCPSRSKIAIKSISPSLRCREQQVYPKQKKR